MTEVLSLLFGYRVSSGWQQLRGNAVLVGCREIRLSQSKYGETKIQGRVLGLAYNEKTKKATVWEGLINLTNRPRWRGERGIRNTRWEGMWQQNKTPPRRKKRPLRPPKRTARAAEATAIRTTVVAEETRWERNVATEKDTTKAAEISHKRPSQRVRLSNLAPLRIGYQLNIGGRKEATTGPVQP